MAEFFHVVMARLRGFLRPDALDREFAEELEAHLALAEEEKIRRGMTPEEARRTARVELGGLTQLREAGREARGLPQLDTFRLDIKLALRLLRKSWGLALIGGLAMTLAIILGVAVYTIFTWATGDSLPLEDGERVIAFEILDAKTRRPQGASMQDLERWRDNLRSVVDVGAFQTVERNVSVGNGLPEVMPVAEITASGFRLARVAPRMGRTLIEDDEVAGAAPVVVLGYDLWQSRLAGDPQVVGRTLQLDGTPHTVVGVMPEGFAFPVDHRLWTPLRAASTAHLPPAPTGAIFGRLAPAAALESAQAELATVGLAPTDGDPETVDLKTGDRRQARVLPYITGLSGDSEESRWVLRLALILVALLLVPPCANIAILVYARTITRQEEFAARYSLGASRRRIVVQLFIEMLVLAVFAAGVALITVRVTLGWAVDKLIMQPDGGVPFWMDLTMPAGSVLFAACLAVLAALVAGLVPALKATGRSMQTGLRGLGSRTGIQLGATWTALVVAQVAMTLAALPTAVEIGWGTVRKGVLGPGFAAEEYLTARLAVNASLPGYSATDGATDGAADGAADLSASRFRALQDEVVRKLRAVPGVSGVTVGELPGDEPWESIEFERDTQAATDMLPARSLIRMGRVDDAFFEVFDIPLLGGRFFGAGDFAPESRVVIVNRTFARRHFGEANPLGVRLRHAPRGDTEATASSASRPWYEIVGVVEDRPAGATNGTVYYPAAVGRMDPVGLAVRMRFDPAAMTDRIREIVTKVDPGLQVTQVRTLEAIYREKALGNNLGAVSLGALMLSVLLLSAAGMYALMSFTVNQRRREIGIRSALGAPPRHLLMAIFKRSLRQLAIGAVAGVLVALLVAHSLPAEQLGGWKVPGVIPAATLFMLIVGLLAVAGPADRGMRVDPIEELRKG